MRKIPTIFLRDPDDMSRVLPVPNSDAVWVFAGQGHATRMYDGTCVGYLSFHFDTDEPGVANPLQWYARREVKPGKAFPPGYVPVQLDPATGKTMGWEPIENSAFAAFHVEALEIYRYRNVDPAPGTYELLGPKINGNHENRAEHVLLPHDLAMPLPEVDEMIESGKVRPNLSMPQRAFDLLGHYLEILPYEGIVWHAQDGSGRMAKIKRADFEHPWPIK